jgi:divalent metal cation (Fe/Co/Zn/Cd) transporter
MQESKDPSLFSVVCEDSADLLGIAFAFLGVYFSHRLDAPRLDGAASIAVGLVLAAVALFLIAQSRRLLIGEGADVSVQRTIASRVRDADGIRSASAPLTMHLGPDEILVGLQVELDPALRGDQVAGAIERLERGIREAEPTVRYLFVEASCFGRVPPGTSDDSEAQSATP